MYDKYGRPLRKRLGAVDFESEEVDSDAEILARRTQRNNELDKIRRACDYVKAKDLPPMQAWAEIGLIADQQGWVRRTGLDGKYLVYNHGRNTVKISSYAIMRDEYVDAAKARRPKVQDVKDYVGKTFRARLKPANKGPNAPEYESVMEPVDPDGPPTYVMSLSRAENEARIAKDIKQAKARHENARAGLYISGALAAMGRPQPAYRDTLSFDLKEHE
jgi:hypothetical protein